jgi:hypothetical protein
VIKTAKRTLIYGALIIVAGVLTGLLEVDFFFGDERMDIKPPTGDHRRALIVVDWSPDVTGPMSIRVDWGGRGGGTLVEMESPVQEHNDVEIGQRIEVDAHKKGGPRPDYIRIAATIQSAKGDYPMPMLCTEPTLVRKVCVGVVT